MKPIAAVSRKSLVRIAILFLALIIVALIMNSNWIGRLMYPIQHRETIWSSGSEFSVDPMLIAAVIRVESKFQKENVSDAGAIGLMQLMPDTAKWIAAQSGIAYSNPKELEEVSTNIKLGSWYLAYLNKRFSGKQAAAIAAYNAGPTRVEQWVQNGQWDGTFERSDDIPVGETRHFVQRVLFNLQMYHKYYEKQ